MGTLCILCNFGANLKQKGAWTAKERCGTALAPGLPGSAQKGWVAWGWLSAGRRELAPAPQRRPLLKNRGGREVTPCVGSGWGARPGSGSCCSGSSFLISVALLGLAESLLTKGGLFVLSGSWGT